MTEELLERIPPEKRWAITAKFLIGCTVLIGPKTVVHLLGEGIFVPA
jgi:hypothetical protein